MKLKKSRFVLLIILILLFECKNESSFYSAKNIVIGIEKGTDSTSVRSYYSYPKNLRFTVSSYFGAQIITGINYFDTSGNKVRQIESTMAGIKYGHYFKFFESGNIETYYYKIGDGKNTRFVRKYGENGSLISEVGTPLVDYIPDEDNRKVTLFFTDIFFDSLHVIFSTPSKTTGSVSLQKSAMQPFLLEGQVPDSISIFKITAIEKANRESKTYYDTLIVK